MVNSTEEVVNKAINNLTTTNMAVIEGKGFKDNSSNMVNRLILEEGNILAGNKRTTNLINNNSSKTLF